MIISDLCDEYAVLVSQNKAPVYGYDNVNVPYGLVINDDGILVEVRLLGDFSGKKPINKISVPARFVKTSGIVPDFLCGNAEYMLGYNTEKPEHAVKAFQACAQLHMQILEGIDDPVASAVRAFFLQGPQWEIAKRLMGDCWESSLKMNFALQHVDGAQTIFVGDFPGIQKAWNTYYDQKGNDDKSSLVSSFHKRIYDTGSHLSDSGGSRSEAYAESLEIRRTQNQAGQSSRYIDSKSRRPLSFASLA